MRTIIFFIILFSTNYNCFAQAEMQIQQRKTLNIQLLESEKLEIKEIKISDSILLEQIELMISDKEKTDSIFAKRGYIEVIANRSTFKNQPTLRTYIIKDQYANFDNLENDYAFPLFYSKVNDRIVVVIFDELGSYINYQIKNDSKKKFQVIIEPFLDKQQPITISNADGTKKEEINFRPMHYNIHGGKVLHIFENNTFVVENNIGK